METSEVNTPTHPVARRFPAIPSSVGQARRFLLASLPDATPAEADELVLLLSELATNAVQHAATEFEVAVLVAPDGRSVRVEVSDGAAGYPTPQEQVPDAPNGRGLHIVRAMADGWGIEMQRDRPGKIVWFTMPLSGGGPGRPAAREEPAETDDERVDASAGATAEAAVAGAGAGPRPRPAAKRTGRRCRGPRARRPGRSRACGPCSTGCATRSWSPTGPV